MNRLLVFTLGVLLPIAAAAQEIPESHHVPGVPWQKLTFTLINFLIFVYIISRAWPTLRNFMIERRDRVREALEKADRARREGQQTAEGEDEETIHALALRLTLASISAATCSASSPRARRTSST